MENQLHPGKPYLRDVIDEEWAFAAPSLALKRPDAPQPHHDLREVLTSVR